MQPVPDGGLGRRPEERADDPARPSPRATRPDRTRPRPRTMRRARQRRLPGPSRPCVRRVGPRVYGPPTGTGRPSGRRRGLPSSPSSPPPTPGGSARRICSSCARAAICWANSVVWIPWKRPSSQPTNWACAMRSSASLGIASSVKGRESRSSSSTSSGRETVLQLLHRAGVDLLEPHPARLVQRGRPHLLQQLLDHAADAHDLGRLLDHLRHRDLAGVRRLRRRRAPFRPGPRPGPGGSPATCSFLGISMPPFSRTRTSHIGGAPIRG